MRPPARPTAPNHALLPSACSSKCDVLGRVVVLDRMRHIARRAENAPVLEVKSVSLFSVCLKIHDTDVLAGKETVYSLH